MLRTLNQLYIHSFTLTLLQVSDTDEESDKEFEYNSAIDDSSSSDDESSDEEDAMCYLGNDDLSHGRYVQYQWEDKSYYVGNVTDINVASDEEVQCSGKESLLHLATENTHSD